MRTHGHVSLKVVILLGLESRLGVSVILPHSLLFLERLVLPTVGAVRCFVTFFYVYVIQSCLVVSSSLGARQPSSQVLVELLMAFLVAFFLFHFFCHLGRIGFLEQVPS